MADFIAVRNSRARKALTTTMHTTRPFQGQGDVLDDRRPIMVDTAGRQQGIAAALRRAFERVEPVRDDDFADLLKRL